MSKYVPDDLDVLVEPGTSLDSIRRNKNILARYGATGSVDLSGAVS